MTDNRDLTTPAELPDEPLEARAERLSRWADDLDGFSAAAKVTRGGQGAGRALLEAALGSAAAVEEAVKGRPSLDGQRGKSPTRTIRLPRELDAALVARADAEHRKPSELVREAVASYLSERQAC